MSGYFDSREITGRTRVLGILAHPTGHVKAPPAINRIAAARERDAVMVPFDVAPEDLTGVVQALRRVRSLDGAIVTVPHKQAAVALCDEVTPQAAAVGAVNILRFETDGRLVGGQLDGIGFVAGLRAAGIDPAGMRVFLAGAGGAANAVAFALADAGVSHVTLSNRSRQKIEDLRDRLRTFKPGLSVSLCYGDARGHDLVVNGTTLGMRVDDPLPLDISTLGPDMIVAEVIMEPETTALLHAAQKAGCRTHLGRHMLEHQLELMADFMGL